MRTLSSSFEAALAQRLADLEEAGLLREPRPLERGRGPYVLRDGRALLDLSSNDYLGLADHPAIGEAIASALGRGAGARSSRLVVGTDPGVVELEERLAAFKGTEAALVLGSGFLANVGVLPAVLDRDDAVFCDRLDHASIWDGARLSGARLHRYRHADPDHLEELLARSARRGARRRLIVTESVFSMDGDVAPLPALVELARRYDAALVVDDAHGGGVFGEHGEGYAHEVGVADRVDLELGTFSKAFGLYGAYVAGSATWIRYLANACRAFVYTTALPPPLVAGIGAALDVVRAAGERRRSLARAAARFRAGLDAAGFDTCGSSTQIVPAVVGDARRTVALAAALEERGVLAVAIRPPTVPAGSARIRFSVTAAHTDEQLDGALRAIAACAADEADGPPTPEPAQEA